MSRFISIVPMILQGWSSETAHILVTYNKPPQITRILWLHNFMGVMRFDVRVRGGGHLHQILVGGSRVQKWTHQIQGFEEKMSAQKDLQL